MAKDPAFLFYSSDFLTGVMSLSFEDRGKYITILALMHQQGRLDEETIWLVVGSFSDKLKAKFAVDESGKFYNERLEKETEKRNKYAESRRNNGLGGGRPKKTKEPYAKPYVKHITNHSVNENINENEIININEKEAEIEILEQYPFSEFWDLYDKKTGRSDCEKKYKKLSGSEKAKIFENLPAYIFATPDKKFRKNPETYINGKHWEDEIVTGGAVRKKTNIENLLEISQDNSLFDEYKMQENQ